ncbi:DUF2383 domain-containing protein [Zobellia russellii]|uniref:DUF2383 domain-containing protein n=1 Tax=Zobellia russellii TaxID=248907 RepID=UPI001BFFAFB5|nr:DUF2383 domain-containing protein [Zobellia russellii]MBT9188296.1 DUF2383 domain-containing protein [Zobellia russellii]
MMTKLATKTLDGLINKNIQAERVFFMASKKVTAESLTQWFDVRKNERRDFQIELTKEMNSCDISDKDLQNTVEDLVYNCIDFKTIQAATDDETILKEALRAEKAAVDEYNSMLSNTKLPSRIVVILKKHCAKIEYGLAILKELDSIQFQEES